MKPRKFSVVRTLKRAQRVEVEIAAFLRHIALRKCVDVISLQT